MSAPTWISPAAAANMLTHVSQPAKDDFSVALLTRSTKKRSSRTTDLARAKLQPRQPTAVELAGSDWPITAHASQLVLSQGAADVSKVSSFFATYDQAAPDHLDLLAVVLTVRFPHSIMLHDQMAAVSTYAHLMLSHKRRLTTLLAHHAPGSALSSQLPHVHALVLSRVHHPCGWGQVHEDFAGDKTAIHARFRDEWHAFARTWSGQLPT